MAIVKVLARDWGIYVFDQEATDGGAGEDHFQRIGGLNNFGLEPDSETTDTTDFDTDGYGTHLVSGRSNSISLEGHYKEDDSTGDPDPGQKIVEGLAAEVGPSAETTFRLVSPSGNTKEYDVTFTLGTKGGGVQDVTSWGATANVSGKPREIDTGTDDAIYND